MLFEACTEDGLCEGYTDTYVRVRAAALPGDIRDVLITEAKQTLCLGQITK